MVLRFKDEAIVAQARIDDLNLLTTDFKRYIKYALCLMADMPKYYLSASAETKNKLVCSIFPQKIPVYKTEYRTPEINDALKVILLKTTTLTTKEKGLNIIQSLSVARRGIEPLLPE